MLFWTCLLLFLPFILKMKPLQTRILISELAKSLEVRMRNSNFDRCHSITIISFFEEFKFTFDASDTDEVAAMWLLSYFMEGIAWDELRAKACHDIRRLSSSSSLRLASYPKLIKYLLSKYATNDIIADVNFNLSALEQGHFQSSVDIDSYVAAWAR